MAETRHATATWSGNLTEGSGMLLYISSGAVSRLPLTWGSRTEAHEGRTSPEELLAAAHASCFSMAFSNQLAKNGTVAEKLDVRVDVTADKRDAGWTVLSSAIKVTGVVPRIDAETFAKLADAAKEGCPISRAIAGNVELSVEPTLVSG
jgi:osmotically inducible protein OsmC